MRRFTALLPHLSISLNTALLIVVIINEINPRLGLLRGGLFLVLLGAGVLSAVLTACVLVAMERAQLSRHKPRPEPVPVQVYSQEEI